ncbi:penicillin-binding transpeptidase domain-containing protein [Pseudomonas aeruginosa]|uniref:penicillin-binding transpeptidase domain-containing protein n=1 Tax=Pseudomonas aeruginosa TaxID=287 RepID=UPI002174EC6D|nr:penicillin-binding transpeptidase domain-containing protein [Pseudomonas aeruginosa]
MNLYTATAESDNTVFAQLTRLVGPQNIATTAHALGIQSRLPGYFAIGLGGLAVNPLEMARAYAAFANGGRRLDGTLTGNRPIVVTPLGVRLCRPSEAVLDLLPQPQRGAFNKEDGEPLVDEKGRRV